MDAFERGRLPGVCILSGEPTDDKMNVTVSNRPAVGWLLLFGVIPYVIVKAMMTTSVSGSLPMTEEVYRGVKEAQRKGIPLYLGGFTAGVAGALLLLLSVPGPGAILFGVGVAIVLAGAVITARSNPLRGLQLDRTGRWVELSNAADHFADTIAALLIAGDL
ncbi:MAG: hypothetical protein ABIS47_13825 [Acidimicrobiales bacterium]